MWVIYRALCARVRIWDSILRRSLEHGEWGGGQYEPRSHRLFSILIGPPGFCVDNKVKRALGQNLEMRLGRDWGRGGGGGLEAEEVSGAGFWIPVGVICPARYLRPSPGGWVDLTLRCVLSGAQMPPCRA